ncbi:MAG: hypothetical protein WEB60_09885 [Terrimicrobiaceae bacterium]
MNTHRVTSNLNHFLPALILLIACTAGHAGQSAKQAAFSLPDRFRESIVKISADNGTPDPKDWYFVCRAAHSADGILSITVRNGRIIQQKPTLDLRVALGNYSKINLSKVLVDSRGAFAIAQRYVSKEKGATLGNVSYLLQQSGDDADPIWSIWCYDPSVRYLGLLKLMASTGDVILWE